MQYYLRSITSLICLLGTQVLLSVPAVQATPTDQNTLNISGQFEFSSLDSTRRGYVFQRMQIIETFLEVDEKGQLLPGLAERWEVSEDGKTWDFWLREGVTFHDGSALTAQAAVNSLTINQSKPGALSKAPISSIEAVSEQQVRVQLDQVFRPLGAVFAHYTSAILAPAAFDAQNEVQELIGTGPYKVYEISMPHKFIVTKFDQYWGQVGTIEYARYLTGHRTESRVLQAKSGDSHIVFGIDAATAPSLKRLPHLSVLMSQLPRTLVLKLNLGQEALASAKVRDALSLAIYRKGIAAAVLRTPQAATDQLLPDYMGAWHVNTPMVDYDLAKAEQLLVNDGWAKNSEGWMVKNGKPLTLTLITYADRPELVTVATALQDQWQKLGVKLNVNVTNSSAIPAGHQDGSLEVALMARNYGSIADPLGVMLQDFATKNGGDWGSMNWNNPTAQNLLGQLAQTQNNEAFYQGAQQVAKAIYDEKPMLAIASYVQHTAVHTKVKGFKFDPYERSYFLNQLTLNP